MKRVLHATVIMLATTLLLSCSGEGPEREGPADGSGDGASAPPSGGSSGGTEAGRVPLVPIAHLSTDRARVTVEELSGAGGLAVPRAHEASAGRMLDRSGFETRDTAEGVVREVSREADGLGLVPWHEVDPRVRALPVGGSSFFEPGDYPRDYPLAPDGAAWPERRTRTVVAGGDMWLDRGMPHAVYDLGYGMDFPLEGGYAEVLRRREHPSEFSEWGEIHTVRAERRGGAGTVREYLRGADLTLANLECPVLADAEYHPEGTVFEGDLDLLPVVQDAGIDGVTLGNNHILDARYAGLEETIHHLDEAGLAHAGAGSDLASAREPMVFDLDGVEVGVLSYQGVPGYEWSWADEGTPGTSPLTERAVREDVRRLQERVDVVIVMPHWGEEYTATPEEGQAEIARSAVEAGADAVIGGHAHWVKGMEVYGERPVYYGVGNFLADQTWSEETSTGIFAELTLHGGRVVQSRPVPFLVMDFVQPNLLLPDGGGERALDRLYAASRGPEFETIDGP